MAVQGQGSDFAKMGTADNDIHIGLALSRNMGGHFSGLIAASVQDAHMVTA